MRKDNSAFSTGTTDCKGKEPAANTGGNFRGLHPSPHGMSQVTQPSLLGAVGDFPIRFLKCRALCGCPGACPQEKLRHCKEKEEGTCHSWNSQVRPCPHTTLGSLIYTETSNLAKVRCSQDISLRLVFIITTDSGC